MKTPEKEQPEPHSFWGYGSGFLLRFVSCGGGPSALLLSLLFFPWLPL
jgi:hypothetical protein